MKFSIIVPCYNIENYIGELVDSVLMQDFIDFELILVDDGSIDRTVEILDGFQAKDRRIKVVHTTNHGPGAARNTGIYEAKGEYILFFDGDDLVVDKGALSQLNKIITCQKKHDIVLYPVKYMSTWDKVVHDANVYYEDEFNECRTFEDMLERMLKSGKILSSPCEQMFSRSFLLQHKLLFPVGVFSEDIEWIIRIMLARPRIYFTNYSFYCYRFDRPGSTCNSEKNASHEEKIIDFLNTWSNSLKSCNDRLSRLVLNYLAYHYCIAMSNVAAMSGRDADRLFGLLDSLSWLLNFDVMRKVRLFHIVARIFGSKRAAQLGRWRYEWKRKQLTGKG